MKTLEDFLKPTQKQLFSLLRKVYKGKTVVSKGQFILVKGDAPIMLVAHLDTVHEKSVSVICKSSDGNILMSPQGIGGDDRCGVYALATVYEAAFRKPWLLFTCDEEIGGRGADAFALAHEKGKLPKEVDSMKLLIEIDRRGSKDAVYYDCDNQDLEEYITSKGFETASGSFSDISYIAPELGVAAVNLSSGYYNAHTLHEFINRKHLDAVIAKVSKIVQEASLPNFPKYEYRERVRNIFVSKNWANYDLGFFRDKPVIPTTGAVRRKKPSKPIPAEYVDMYDTLLDYYGEEEIESYRETFGDKIIAELYESEFGPYFEKDDDAAGGITND